MKYMGFLLILSLAFTSSSLFAHTGLKQSEPEHDAMLMASPADLKLTFSDPVRLVKLTLKNSNGAPVQFGFKPVVEAKAEFAYPLQTLDSGQYTVSWMVLGKDGHKMEGEYSFMLHSTTDNNHHSIAKPKKN